MGVKNRMNEEVEDLLLDLERAQAQASTMEKKQKKVDAQINEWKQKCADLQGEVDKAQKDSRNASSEVLKIRANFQDLEEKYDSVKKENRALAAEVQSMNERLSDGGRSSVE